MSTGHSTPTTPPKTADRLFDAIQMEVFSNRLLAIAEDMGSILIRSSFSSRPTSRSGGTARRHCSTRPAG